MKKYILPLLLAGCAPSMKSLVVEHLDYGASKNAVVKLLGTPNILQKADDDQTALLMIYSRSLDTCAITIKDDKVSDFACIETPISPKANINGGLGKMLKDIE